MVSSSDRSASTRGRGLSLVVNFLPVRFHGEVVDAGVLPYVSTAQVEDLKSRLRATHVVLHADGQIVCVPIAEGAEQIGERRNISAGGGDLPVRVNLLHTRLKQVLTEQWRYKLLHQDPLQFVSRVQGRDLLEKALRRSAPGLHVFPKYKLEVRRNGPGGHPGVVVGLKTRYEIDLPVSELLRRGLDVIGLYVLAESTSLPTWPFQDETARRKLLGRLVAVKGDQLVVHTGDGTDEIPAARAWIESNKPNFHAVLAKLAGRSYENVRAELDEQIFELTGAEQRLADTSRIATRLIGLGQLNIANGMKAELARPLGLRKTPSPSLRTLAEPTFVFDQTGDKTHRWADYGLKQFGPLDSESFTPKVPHIAVVVPRQFQGTVETMVESFSNGVRGSDAYPLGFARKFRLTECTFTFTVFDGDVQDAAAYRRACLEALAKGEEIHLALVFTSEAQEHLTGDASPYLVSKSTFMSQGVPVQECQVETIRRGDLASPLSTMALACYAKLGGTPFAISDKGRPMAKELVFGIGSAQVFEDRMRQGERYVGITTVFNFDGSYLVSNVSREAPYEQYPEALLDALRVCITEVKDRVGWRPNDMIRLIFHVFKPLKDREARAVKEMVAGLTSEYAGVDFAFVTIVEDHPWLVLDENAAGTGSGQRRKGKLVPQRGYAVPISKQEMLVTVKGPREIKTALQGAPKPLLIKLHRESTFTDIDYLAGQIFRFTAMSWRRPYPTTRPVTILYSDLIAGLLGKLRQVTNWNSDMILTKLRWSRWFL